MESIPLSVLDELYLNLDRVTEPWTVHYELQLGTRLDPDRLVPAIEMAALRHPLARARLASWRFQDRGYDWEIVDDLQHLPLRVVTSVDHVGVAQERERLFSISPPLSLAPPFALVLAQGLAGDTLILNLNHAAGDGISAARLMLSILRAYVGEDDPVPPLDPLSVHDVRTLSTVRSMEERLARTQALMRGAMRPLLPPTRIALDGGDARPAYGFELLQLSAEPSAALIHGHPDGTTVNDVLLAALALAIVRWNSAHDRRTRPIALSVPVNLRPPDWQFEIVSNFASWVTVWVHPRLEDDLRSVTERVSTTTRAIKRHNLGGLAVDLLELPSRMTIAGKRWLQYRKQAGGDFVVDTVSLSNLGRLDTLPAALDGTDTHVWFSPPAQMPLGVAIGVARFGDCMHVTMRYRHAQFDPAAAQRFVELFRNVLVS